MRPNPIIVDAAHVQNAVLYMVQVQASIARSVIGPNPIELSSADAPMSMGYELHPAVERQSQGPPQGSICFPTLGLHCGTGLTTTITLIIASFFLQSKNEIIAS